MPIPFDLSTVGLVASIPSMVSAALFLMVGIAGFVGLYFAATTRPDAFDAADRQSKGAWCAILGLSGLVCLLSFPFVMWFGAVAIGIYWFDVKPQIDGILNGNYGY